MGRLKDVKRYLKERRRLVSEIEDRLCALQTKYESFFAEVARAREAELEQLIAHTTGDPRELPDWLRAELETEQVVVEGELKNQLAALEAAHKRLLGKAEKRRRLSVDAEHKLRQQNVSLDHEEEQLKERSAALAPRVSEYNRRIRELGTGFGFFANLFRMRRLQAQRRQLDTEQTALSGRIQALRTRWAAVRAEYDEDEKNRRQRWTELETEAAAVAAKIEALQASRPRMVVRSAVERVLDRRETAIPGSGQGTPCPRCTVTNPPEAHFCHICAIRLSADQPDLAGSVEEVAQLNHHFKRFSAGMRACQEIIGLVRGVGSGIDAFAKSVDDMMTSESKYPLAKLKIEVPETARAWGENLERFRDRISDDLSLHPKDFAAAVAELVDEVFTEDAIRTYFETMGEELSRQAETQW